MSDEYKDRLAAMEQTDDIVRALRMHAQFVKLRALDASRVYPVSGTETFYKMARSLMQRALTLDTEARYASDSEGAAALAPAMESALTITLPEIIALPKEAGMWLAEYSFRFSARPYTQGTMAIFCPLAAEDMYEVYPAYDKQFVDRPTLDQARMSMRRMARRVRRAVNSVERALGAQMNSLTSPQLPNGMGGAWPGYGVRATTIVDVPEGVDNWLQPRDLYGNVTLFCARLVVAGLVSHFFRGGIVPRTIPISSTDTVLPLGVRNREDGNPRSWRAYVTYSEYMELLERGDFDDFLSARETDAMNDVVRVTAYYTTALDYVRETGGKE